MIANRLSQDPFFVVRDRFDRLLRSALAPTPEHSVGEGLAINAYEYVDRLELEAELPGVRDDQLDVGLKDRTLSIGVRASAEESMSVRRTLSIPQGFDAEGISARLADGVLTVTLPRLPEASRRSIEVKAG